LGTVDCCAGRRAPASPDTSFDLDNNVKSLETSLQRVDEGPTRRCIVQLASTLQGFAANVLPKIRM
jgi:hypothetical protein